jgi:hypothetical protein
MEMKGTLDEKKNKNNCIILDYHAVPEYRGSWRLIISGERNAGTLLIRWGVACKLIKIRCLGSM